MTYKDNFVVEVKANGQILRVKDGAVNLPFGSEYTLLLKNLNSRRASVKIHIDGQDVLDYSSLVIEPNESTELEGFLKGSIAKNRFKFIQKTKQIQDHRGDKIDDGLIRVEFAFEKKKPETLTRTIITEHHHKDHYYWNYNNWFSGDSSIRYTYGNSSGNSNDAGRGISSDQISCSVNMVQSETLGMQSVNQPLQDEGITVKGSECNQDFRYTSIGELEQSSVITIQLKGMSESGVQIERPLTVQTKLQCKTCGTKSKSSFKFCPNCGTFLE